MKHEPYPNLSLFVLDLLAWCPKVDRHSMELPLFSLSKKKDIKPREYVSKDGNTTVRVNPSHFGMPTMQDYDWLIYAATLIREEIVSGRMGAENQAIKVDTYNFLETTVRGDGAQQFKDGLTGIKRLYGAWIETDRITNGVRTTKPFRLLEDFEIVSESKTGLVTSLEIKLSDWMYGAIYNAEQEMLSIDRDYFKLKGGLERRLYMVIRKHCGNQPFWKIPVETLWTMTGSQSVLKEFRRKVFKIIEGEDGHDIGPWPGYRAVINHEADTITFFSRNHKEAITAIFDAAIPSKRRKKLA